MVEAILDAAARILARDGREAANTNAIARQAGVSIGSLYQYFPDRESIMRALVQRHGERIHAVVAGNDDAPPTDLASAVAEIVAAVFAAHRLDPALHDALDHDFAHRHGGDRLPSTKSAVRERMARLPAAIRAEIRCPEPQHAPLVVSEVAHSLAHAALVHPEAARDEAALERQAVSAVLAYLTT
ncbi:MAG: TetR/AcrR family transcriptional regulator, partial [Rhizorhabdus sp.]